MAYVFAEGFDDMKIGNNDMPVVFTSHSSGGSDQASAVAGLGRNGGTAIQLGASVVGFVKANFDPGSIRNLTTVIPSFSFLQTVDGQRTLIAFEDVAGNLFGEILRIAGGQMVVKDSTGAIVFTSPGVVFPLSSWQFLEVKLTVGATGTMEIRIDQTASGASAFTVSGEDFLNGSGFVQQLHWRGQNSSSLIDDALLLDTTGTVNNDFIGDGFIDHLRPNVDATPNDFTATPGGDHFATVDEVPPDDADFLESNVVGDAEVFGFAPMTAGGAESIDFVAISNRVSRNGGDATAIRQKIISGGQEDIGVTRILSTALGYVRHGADVDPNTGQRWTRAAVDALTAGFEVAP